MVIRLNLCAIALCKAALASGVAIACKDRSEVQGQWSIVNSDQAKAMRDRTTVSVSCAIALCKAALASGVAIACKDTAAA
jgi:hypothetical protein